ncbi:alcohol acetyltransferase [Xylariaceae sp. FL0662B]|nr:alcohol acetyltransferase [Xylariaceae sp. FL0662B]
MTAQQWRSPRKGANESKCIRRLGFIEAYHMAMETLDQYRGTTVTCRYAIPSRLASEDTLTELMGIFEDAVAQVVQRHPLLHVGIMDADSKRPVWAKLDNIDLRQHIEWRFLDTGENMASLLHETTETELDSRYPDLENRPGWKIVVLHQRGTDFLEVVLNFNHVNADGIGAKVFHEDILQCLNSGPTDEIKRHFRNHILQVSKHSLEFPEPIEKLCKLRVDAPFFIKTLWKELGPSFGKGQTQADWAPIRGSPYSTRLRSFSIEASPLAELLISCRNHSTSITALLHSLMLASLASHIKDAPGFASGTPLDQRRFLPTDQGFRPERTIANYVTVMNHDFPADPVAQIRSKILPRAAEEDLSADVEELVWSVAAKVRTDIQNKLALGTKNDPLGFAKLVGDWQAHLKHLAQKPRPHSWVVTNLGVIDGGSQPSDASTNELRDSWSICAAQFAIPTEVPSGALVISPVTVAGGPLCITCSWQDNVVDASLAESVMADLRRWLIQLASHL